MAATPDCRFLRALIDDVRDVVFHLDPQGRWTFLNAAWPTLSGHGVDESLGRSLLDFLEPAQHDEVRATLARLVEGGPAPVLHELPLRRPDGRTWWGELQAHPVRDAAGVVIGLTGTLRDVTERRRLAQDEALRAVEVSVLHELAERLVRTERADEVFQFALQALERAAGLTRAAVLLVETDGVCRFQAWRGVSEAYRQVAEGHFPWTSAEDPQPIVVEDVTRSDLSPELKVAAAQEHIAGLAFIPLVQQGRAVGKFNLYFERPGPLPARVLELARSVASTVSVAIQRYSSLQRLVDESRRDAAIRGLLSLALENVSLDRVLEHGLDTILSVPGLGVQPRGGIFLLDRAGGPLALRVHRGFDPARAAACAQVASGECLCGEVAVTGELRTSSTGHREGSRCRGSVAHGHVVAPLKVGERVVGVLTLYTDGTAEPQPRELAFIDVMARTLASLVERHRAQDVLERERLLFAAGPVVAFRWAVEDGWPVEYVSPNVSQLGHSAEAMMRQRTPFATLLHPADLTNIGVEVKAQLDSGAHFFVQTYRLRSGRDGTYRWVEDYTKVERDAQGAVTGLLGYLVDVSDRVAAEEALRRSEADFRALIEHSVDGVLVLRQGQVAFANDAAARMHGMASPRQLVGRQAHELVGGADVEVATRRVADVLRTGQASAPREFELLKADGSTTPAELWETAITFGGGPAVLCVARDLTDRRAVAAKLMQMDRMIAVGTMATGVAHEINNPLSYVLGNVRYVTDVLDALAPGAQAALPNLAEVKEALADARVGAERVRDIVGDLKRLARAEPDAGASTDLRAVLDSALSIAKAELHHRARVVRDFGELPKVRGAQGKLGQVFLNLLVNAAQAITEGRPDANEVRVAAHVDAEWVTVEVEDSGSGIAPEHLPRIFDPFFTTKPVGQGTGLGLSICQGIVRSLGGDITAHSTPGRGTVFSVTLPRFDAHLAVAPPLREAMTPAHGVRLPGTPVPRARVLVVDDDPLVVSSLERLLASRYAVESAAGGAEALRLFETGRRYEAVLCDLMMPQLPGWAFHEKLRELSRDQARRVVFMTAGAFTPEASTFLARIPNPRLGKPFDVDEVGRVLEAVVSGSN